MARRRPAMNATARGGRFGRGIAEIVECASEPLLSLLCCLPALTRSNSDRASTTTALSWTRASPRTRSNPSSASSTCAEAFSCLIRAAHRFPYKQTTLPLIGFAEIPLTPLQLRAVATVARSTWWTPSMHKDWWSHWYSWLGGPVWRYGIGLLLGYRRYDPSDTLFPVRDSSAPYVALSTPRLTPLLLVMSGWFVFGVAVAMIVTIVLNSRRGLSTVQVERVRRWKARSASSAQGGYDARIRLWVPLPREECKEGGLVLLVDPDVGLFDLGPRENWRRLMGAEKWWWWFGERIAC